MTRPRVLLAAITVTLTLAGIAHARPGGNAGMIESFHHVAPIPAPQALLRARQACPNQATVAQCRAALRRAYAGLEWARKDRIHRYQATVDTAITVACATYPTVDCAWFNRMITCESERDPHAKNQRSTASGLGQELDGTFAGTPYGKLDVFDPFVGALSSAWLAARAGRSPWLASEGCWA